MSIPEFVREHYNLGYAFIPVGPNKKPLVKWSEYQNRQPAEEELEQWAQLNPSCWAVVTGRVSGVVVLDFDGPEGAQTLQNLGLKAHIKTPSGGNHVYVKYPGVPVQTLNGKSKRNWAHFGQG